MYGERGKVRGIRRKRNEGGRGKREKERVGMRKETERKGGRDKGCERKRVFSMKFLHSKLN